MTRDEITNIVEKNLAKIHVGDKFPTQQKLFTALRQYRTEKMRNKGKCGKI